MFFKPARILLALVTALFLFVLPFGTAQSQSGMVADNGFRPEVDGFKFENYGGGFQDLTPPELQRLFGDQVCATLEGGNCTLTPPAQQWMENVNKAMNGGHCEGFAALSLVFFQDKGSISQFGAGRVFDLELQGNEKLQREIALYWATQATAPTNTSEVKGTPSEILDVLIRDLKPGSNVSYTIGIYKPDRTGGHANTPYAVQDLGGGKYAVKIYENNFPGQPFEMIIDRNANTWSYQATTNPNEPSSLYTGDASTQTLTLTPTQPRLTKQNCPFCEGGGGGLAQATPKFNQIWLEREPTGKIHLLITDAQGKRMGYVNGKLVNEIPGAQYKTIRGKDLWKDAEEPVYYVPTSIQFTVTVDATDVATSEEASVTMIGPGYDVAVDSIVLDKGQKDTITFSADGTMVSYKTDYDDTPDIIMGFEAKGADYAFLVRGAKMDGGSSLDIALDKTKGTFKLSSTGGKQQATYEFLMGRFDEKREQYFGTDELKLNPKDAALVDYSKWTGNGATMPVGIDRDHNGSVDETIQLQDEDQIAAQPTTAPKPAQPSGAAPAAQPTSAPAQPPAQQPAASGGGICGAIAFALFPLGTVFVLKRKKK